MISHSLALIARVIEGSFLEGEDKTDLLLLTLETIAGLTAIPIYPTNEKNCWDSVCSRALHCLEICITSPTERFGSPTNLILSSCGKILLRSLTGSYAQNSSTSTAATAVSITSVKITVFFSILLQKLPSLQPAICVLLQHAALLASQIKRSEFRLKAAAAIATIVCSHKKYDSSSSLHNTASSRKKKVRASVALNNNRHIIDDSFLDTEDVIHSDDGWSQAINELHARYTQFLSRLTCNSSASARGFALCVIENMLLQEDYSGSQNGNDNSGDISMESSLANASINDKEAELQVEKDCSEILLICLIDRCGDKSNNVRSRALFCLSSVLDHITEYTKSNLFLQTKYVLLKNTDSSDKTVVQKLKGFLLLNMQDIKSANIRRYALKSYINYLKLLLTFPLMIMLILFAKIVLILQF